MVAVRILDGGDARQPTRRRRWAHRRDELRDVRARRARRRGDHVHGPPPAPGGAPSALGAPAGGAIPFTPPAALGAALGGAASPAALTAATAIALAAALGEALGVRIVPQIRRQVPEPWRRTLPLPLAAGLYGV